MSRTIGDTRAKQWGVIANPRLNKWKLEVNDKYIVCASDGLWDFVSDQKVMQICANLDRKGKSPQIIAEALAHRAFMNWYYYEFGTVDDITIIVIFLNCSEVGNGLVQAGSKLAEASEKNFKMPSESKWFAPVSFFNCVNERGVEFLSFPLSHT